MNRISCDVCLDLIPLIKDDIGSEDSKALVLEHIKCCASCNKIYGNQPEVDYSLNSLKVSKKIKSNLRLLTVLIIFIGIFTGIIITDGMYVFYNVLLMPAIGFIGYFALKNKVISLLMGIFTTSIIGTLVVTFIKHLLGHPYDSYDIFTVVLYSSAYTFFSIIGVTIAWLFWYAFKKEN